MKTAGIIFLVLGALAILFPHIAGLSYNYILAYLILFAGAVHLWWAWRPSLDGRTHHLLLGLLFLAAGLGLVIFPWIGLISFTIILGASFLIQGGVQLAMAANSPRLVGNSKTMLVVSGLAGILAGALIDASHQDQLSGERLPKCGRISETLNGDPRLFLSYFAQ